VNHREINGPVFSGQTGHPTAPSLNHMRCLMLGQARDWRLRAPRGRKGCAEETGSKSCAAVSTWCYVWSCSRLMKNRNCLCTVSPCRKIGRRGNIGWATHATRTIQTGTNNAAFFPRLNAAPVVESLLYCKSRQGGAVLLISVQPCTRVCGI